MSEPVQTTQIALIGAGPVGIEVAVALKKAGLSYVHFDAGQVGQTVSQFPFETRFFSSNERIAIAGVPLQTPDQNKSSREEYLTYLRTVVQLFDLQIRTYEQIVDIHGDGDECLLSTRSLAGQGRWRVKKVILSTGGTAHPRKLGIAGENQPNVHHGYRDPHAYFQRRVMVVGGRNSAVEAALRLHHVGARVAISYRRAAFDQEHIKYWLYPEITGLIHAGRIQGHFETVPLCIEGSQLTLRHVRTGEIARADADFLLCLIGYEADMTLARMAGVVLDPQTQVPAIDMQTMQTNMPGVYIAGTAIAGTQNQFRIFIENCHPHAHRIVASLMGKTTSTPDPQFFRPES